MRKTPELCLDVTCSKFDGGWDTKPWDDEYSWIYVGYEEPLGGRWAKQILSGRSKEDVQKAAESGCAFSQLE